MKSIDSGLNDLDDKRIQQATDSLLQERGFIKSETPQLYVNFFARESISNSRNTLGIGIGGGGGTVGVGVSGGIPIGGRVVNQQFTMDFIDVSKDDLVLNPYHLKKVQTSGQLFLDSGQPQVFPVH